jgi:stress-induced-phosphoprotein 1
LFIVILPLPLPPSPCTNPFFSHTPKSDCAPLTVWFVALHLVNCSVASPHSLVLPLCLYAHCREYERCVECCDAAVVAGEAAGAEDSLLGKAHFRCGKALVELKRFDDAVKAFKRALERNRCAEYLKAKNDALKQHEKFLAEREYDPLKAQSAKARGNDHYQKQEFPEAVREYERAIRHDPKNPQLVSRVSSNRSACYMKMGEMALAMRDAEAAIEADPTFVKAHLRKGRVLSATEQWGEAVKAYNQALKLDPHNYDARTGLEKAQKGVDLLNKTAAARAEEAMNKKEIREIWEDMRWLLKEMTENPGACA